MKRRVVYSKENKRSLRWLQAAGQCKAPFTVIIDLSFARAIVREATSSTPSLKQIAIPHFDGNATKLMNDKLEVPCRVVVTAATMQAADKFRNEVRENQQPKQQKYHQNNNNNNNNDSGSKAQKASSALSSQKEKKADPSLNNDMNNNNAIYNKKNYVEEDYRMANDVRAFLKSCELWSPPPQEMDVNGPGKEHKAIAESVLFGRPGLEVRPANAKVPHHGVIVATHNPDTKNEIVSAIGRFGVKSEVAVCVMRCLSKPFALRLDPLNDQNNASSNSRGAASSSASQNQQQQQQQQQQPLSHRALADLHFIKKLKDQNLISNNKANYVVTKLSGGSSSAAAMVMAAKNKNNNATSKPGEDAAAAGDKDGDDLKKIREVVVEQEKKNKELVQAAREKFMNKKAKKEIPASSSVAPTSVSKATTATTSSSKHSNPLATKKKQVRVPLKVSKN